MIERCEDANSKDYGGWGGRGIKVCARWRESFEAFYADMGPKPSRKHSLDRIDNDGNYEPGKEHTVELPQGTRTGKCLSPDDHYGECLMVIDGSLWFATDPPKPGITPRDEWPDA